MQLGARFVLALLLALVQLSGTFAEDASSENAAQELVPFSSDEGLVRLVRSTAKVDFPVLANQFEAQSNPGFCVLHQQRSYSTPFAVGAQTCRAIGAVCTKRTFVMFRRTTIQLFRGSHKTT